MLEHQLDELIKAINRLNQNLEKTNAIEPIVETEKPIPIEKTAPVSTEAREKEITVESLVEQLTEKYHELEKEGKGNLIEGVLSKHGLDDINEDIPNETRQSILNEVLAL